MHKILCIVGMMIALLALKPVELPAAEEACGPNEVPRGHRVTITCPDGVQVTVECLSKCCLLERMKAGACAGHGGLSIDLGLGVLSDSFAEGPGPSVFATPRIDLGGIGEFRISLALPVIYRPGDASARDETLRPVVSEEGPIPRQGLITGGDLRTGSSLIVAPSIESITDLNERSRLGFLVGAGFRYDRGGTTSVGDLGRFTTGDSTNPAITYGVFLERRLSSRTALRWSALGITSFNDRTLVDSSTGTMVMNGGAQTSVMVGLALSWRRYPDQGTASSEN